ncbi:hypothetical protein [Nitrosospira multiformis]|uniref:hypothetical protein n=1 Tax=Nitrosospira multiformis TaxID=1231 RepID=UPI001CA5D016|nr:hypothetical protein [Nitrosospira multiformis]
MMLISTKCRGTRKGKKKELILDLCGLRLELENGHCQADALPAGISSQLGYESWG